MRIITDPECPSCKGKGEIHESIGPYTETYVISHVCHCVKYEHTLTEKELLKLLVGGRHG